MNSGKKKWRSRISIVAAGVALGYAARFALGVPEPESQMPTREFEEPLMESSISDLPILPVEDEFELLLPP
jgi:hypothetical protein